MAIHFLNCLTYSSRVPSDPNIGTLCLLVETNRGLVLVDTGLGQDDYIHKTAIHRGFQVVKIVPMNPEEAAVRQVVQLGYKPEDVQNIVLTHMHIDHCGGLPDFPHARVHVHRREYQAFMGRRRHLADLGYVRRHIGHQPEFALYENTGEDWFDLPAIRLPFEPEMWLVPLFGHTSGHCGVAIQTESGWLFHVGDAAPIEFGRRVAEWRAHLVLGSHTPRLREFGAAHRDVQMTTGHMWLDFFDKGAR